MVVVVLLPRGEQLLALSEIAKPMHREALSPDRAGRQAKTTMAVLAFATSTLTIERTT